MIRFLPFLLLFFSGMASLSYQMIWMREFRLVFGASTASTAAVSALFMAGLGLGGWLLGPKADKHPRPLKLYGMLELGIAILAGLSPFILHITRMIYLKSGGMMVLGMGGATIARLLLAALVMGLPAFLMGGTLPAAARAVTSSDDGKRLSLGALYGINTIGALTGVLLTTFVVLEALGARDTLRLAVFLNIIVAIIAIKVVLPCSEELIAGSLKPNEEDKQVSKGQLSVPMILFSAALFGFVFFLMELVWYRMLAPVLGGSIYTFGLILATALAGIGIGGALHPILFRNREPNAWHLAATCLLEGLAIMIPFAIGDLIPTVASQLRPLSALGFIGLTGSWVFISIIVVFPAAVISGIQFPLLISLLGKGNENVGSQTGLAYAFNTGGSIMGSLAGGFGLMPKLTAPGCWVLSGILLTLLGVIIAVNMFTGKNKLTTMSFPRFSIGMTVIILFGLIACFFAPGPSAAWRHSPIGAGRLNQFHSFNDIREWMSYIRRTTIWEADGVESSVAISNDNGYAFVVNGKIDGNVVFDKGTQIMVGIIGALLHPDPRSTLVVGLGTGCTAGWLAEVPTMERVDVVELESAILHMAELSSLANHNIISKHKSDDGVRIIINDAREVLNTVPESYDLIVSEPSNPYRAGIASLFTKEFYQEVASRLNKGGLFLSWCQAYEIETESVLTIMATLKTVFPYVECWTTQYPKDLLFVASMEPIRPNVEGLESKLESYPFKDAMFYSWGVKGVESFASHHIASSALVNVLAEAINKANINTDDLTPVEYAYANSVGRTTSFSMEDLIQVSQANKQSLPIWMRNRLNNDKQFLNIITGFVSTSSHAISAVPQVNEQTTASRLNALASWANGDMRAFPSLWEQGVDLDQPLEKLALAESLAVAGNEKALHILSELDVDYWVAGTCFIRGVLAEKLNKPDIAFNEFNNAFKSLHKSPWEIPVLIERRIFTAVGFVKNNRKYARQLYDAVKEPFALSYMESVRRPAMLDIATNTLGYKEIEETLMMYYEPNPDWRQDILLLRVQTYQATNNPLLSNAIADYQLFSDIAGLKINDYMKLNSTNKE